MASKNGSTVRGVPVVDVRVDTEVVLVVESARIGPPSLFARPPDPSWKSLSKRFLRRSTSVFKAEAVAFVVGSEVKPDAELVCVSTEEVTVAVTPLCRTVVTAEVIASILDAEVDGLDRRADATGAVISACAVADVEGVESVGVPVTVITSPPETAVSALAASTVPDASV